MTESQSLTCNRVTGVCPYTKPTLSSLCTCILPTNTSLIWDLPEYNDLILNPMKGIGYNQATDDNMYCANITNVSEILIESVLAYNGTESLNETIKCEDSLDIEIENVTTIIFAG